MTNVYRHKNGGGLKVFPAQASPNSLIDGLSTIEGESNVYASSLKDSALKDTFAFDSGLAYATVADSRLADSRIINSDIVGCDVVGAYVEKSRLKDCRVFADCGQPTLYGVTLAGVTVYGDTALNGPWGLELEGAHIHAGEWREQPRHTLIEGEGIHIALVECTEGRAHMGCTCRSVEHWLKKGPGLGRRLGWSEDQVESARVFLEGLR